MGMDASAEITYGFIVTEIETWDDADSGKLDKLKKLLKKSFPNMEIVYYGNESSDYVAAVVSAKQLIRMYEGARPITANMFNEDTSELANELEQVRQKCGLITSEVGWILGCDFG